MVGRPEGPGYLGGFFSIFSQPCIAPDLQPGHAWTESELPFLYLVCSSIGWPGHRHPSLPWNRADVLIYFCTWCAFLFSSFCYHPCPSVFRKPQRTKAGMRARVCQLTPGWAVRLHRVNRHTQSDVTVSATLYRAPVMSYFCNAAKWDFKIFC